MHLMYTCISIHKSYNFKILHTFSTLGSILFLLFLLHKLISVLLWGKLLSSPFLGPITSTQWGKKFCSKKQWIKTGGVRTHVWKVAITNHLVKWMVYVKNVLTIWLRRRFSDTFSSWQRATLIKILLLLLVLKVLLHVKREAWLTKTLS